LAHSIALERGSYCINDRIDCSKTLALAKLLAAGKAPWDFPARRERFSVSFDSEIGIVVAG
jgi:hypothetical protein